MVLSSPTTNDVIEQMIGAGDSGEMVKCLDLKTKRNVVVKILMVPTGFN